MNTLIQIFLDTPLAQREHIGNGNTRQVWATPHLPGLVFKLAYSEYFRNCNYQEMCAWWRMSTAPQYQRYKEYFAPSIALSDDHDIIVMQRTELIPNDYWRQHFESIRKPLDGVLIDNHQANFGFIDGKPVCHDYAHSSII